MRIFTKKAYKFLDRQTGASVKTRPFEFADVPDWVQNDPIFALARKEKSIEVIETKERQKELEMDPTANQQLPLEGQAPDPASSEEQPEGQDVTSAATGKRNKK